MLSNILYILPMILGRTYDARNDRVGIDIFPQSELDRIRPPTNDSFIWSSYETLDSSEDVRKLLELPADLALKVKAGKLDIKGTGSYLRDTSKMGRVIEILTRVKFITKTESLAYDAKPFPSWSTRNKDDLGTHFVKSITYGGELIASVRFKANKDSEFNAISAEVKTSVKKSGDANNLVEGKLEQLQSSLKDRASMEISYYATVPLNDVPNTIEGLKNLVKNFGQHVEEVNNGWGVPIRVELMELSDLGGPNKTRFQFLKNKALELELADVEREFDDVRKSYVTITDWYRTLPASITPEQEKPINALYKRIQKVLRPYYDCIGKLNIEEGPDQQVKEAREAYKEGKAFALPSKFKNEVTKLMKKVEVFEKKMYGTGTGVYVRYGSTTCPSSPMMYQLSSGFLSATTNRGTGGGSSYLCLPKEAEIENLMLVKKPEFGNADSSVISGAKYGLMDEQHPFDEHDVRNYFGRGVPCATCHMTNRTLSHMFPAEDTCPDGWIYEYSGFLMAGSNLPGTHICLDLSPESYTQNNEEQQSHSLSIVHISENEGGLPKKLYAKRSAIRCVVCSQ